VVRFQNVGDGFVERIAFAVCGIIRISVAQKRLVCII
jgi:hypothetical protein